MFSRTWQAVVRFVSLEAEWALVLDVVLFDGIGVVPPGEPASDGKSDEEAEQKEPAIGGQAMRRVATTATTTIRLADPFRVKRKPLRESGSMRIF